MIIASRDLLPAFVLAFSAWLMAAVFARQAACVLSQRALMR